MSRLGSTLSLFGPIQVGKHTAGKAQVIFNTYSGGANKNTYIRESSGSDLEVYVGGVKSATFESDGGILHGSWNVESSLVTSDRRLKTNIMPLQRTLRDVIAPRGEKKVVAAAPATGGTSGDGALWLLRQLRPVSYSFRKGMDSKFMRFGFIADELESVVPEVVRRPGDREVTDQKAVVYQDLIALLAAASQSQQKLIETLEQKLVKQNDRIAKIEMIQQQAEKNQKRKKRTFHTRKSKAKALVNATNETNVTNMTNTTFL
jgi:hypothetical protein